MDAPTASDAEEADSWPHEIFDLTALTSAFFASVSVAPLLAFSWTDFVEADARAASKNPDVGVASISSGMALWAPLSAIMMTFSLIASVLARMLTTAEERASGARRAWLHKAIWPFAILALVPLTVAIIIFPNCLYYAGFIMFPDSITYSPRWLAMGTTFACCGGAAILGAIGIFTYDRRVLLPLEKKERSARRMGAPHTPPAGLGGLAEASLQRYRVGGGDSSRPPMNPATTWGRNEPRASSTTMG